jgi:hypothetical protein
MRYTLEDFDDSRQFGFRMGVANAAGVDINKVVISAIRERQNRRSSGRSLLATSVEVRNSNFVQNRHAETFFDVFRGCRIVE